MAKLSTRLLYGMGVLPLFVLLVSCGTGGTVSGKAQQGKVLDVSTQKPIADAIVVALWKGHAGYSSTVCFHVETTTTDAQGAYHIPAWKKESRFASSSDQRVGVAAYKPGYRWARKIKKNIVYLEPFVGTREERLKYLRQVNSGMSCYTQDYSSKNLIPLRRALYEEAKRIAKTKGDENIVESLLLGLEMLEYGNDIAIRRDIKRGMMKRRLHR